MRIALFQPEIAGNVGTILRLAACYGVPVDIVEPCGFPFSDRALKRAGMDYADRADVTRHPDWDHFHATPRGRLVLLSTRGTVRLEEAGFQSGDTLLLGAESSGVPQPIHDTCDLVVRIPLAGEARSLNVAVAAGIALHEALRQTGDLPR